MKKQKQIETRICGNPEALSHFDFGSELFKFDSDEKTGLGFDDLESKITEKISERFCSGRLYNGFDFPYRVIEKLGNPINTSKNIKVFRGMYGINNTEDYYCTFLMSYETIVAVYFETEDVLVSIRNWSKSTNNHIRLFERYIDKEYDYDCYVEINLDEKWFCSDPYKFYSF